MNTQGLELISDFYASYKEALGKRIVGYPDLVEKLFISFLCEGNVLLEGPPGLGKTSMVKVFSEFLGLGFSRIQFTPDLMPLDIIGSNLLEEAEGGRRAFRFYEGPIFSNVVLGDEINRATPKTQSAFLEAMDEKKVSFLGKVHPLPSPFFVLATQNPIELEGTYPLPEAQVDRFFMKLYFRYPEFSQLRSIIAMHGRPEEAIPRREPGAAASVLGSFKALKREFVVIDELSSFVTKLIVSTHPQSSEIPSVKKYVLYGASPRAAIALMNAATARAVLGGRMNLAYEDVEASFFDVVNHRLSLNFEGESEGAEKANILNIVLDKVRREYRER